MDDLAFDVVTLDEQLLHVRKDRIRVLVVGAGVAGLTITALLRAQGLHPVVIERARSDLPTGYMLGLIPVVDPVLRRLNAFDAYRLASQPMSRYRLHGHTGTTLGDYALDEAFGDLGGYRGIERGRLLAVIAGVQPPQVAMATRVVSLDQGGAAVAVSFVCDEVVTTADFDVVVVADGLHSTTRSLVLDDDAITSRDTGWGGWVAWTDLDAAQPDGYDETWGAGFFIGMYPVPGRTGVFVGGPRVATAAGPSQFVTNVRTHLQVHDERTRRGLAAVATADSPYHWSFTDVWCSTWTNECVVLLGDAAAGFLPTAGVGAAMAMDSAEALARNLAGTQPSGVTAALQDFERQQQPRVEAAHHNSRQLARLMFVRSRIVATVRDAVLRHVPMQMALGQIRDLVATTDAT